MGRQPFPLISVRFSSEMIVCKISCAKGVKVLVTSVSSGWDAPVKVLRTWVRLQQREEVWSLRQASSLLGG